jgi:UDP-glucose 4-epimerase
MVRTTTAVIGGTGFIGRHLLERLAVDTHDRLRVLVHTGTPDWLPALPAVQVVQGDLLQPASLTALLDGAGVVINLAGQVSTDVDDYQGVNLRGMVWLAQACVKHKVRRVIHASSALVYGNALEATEDSPCRPISPYATMKLAAEEILTGLLTAKMQLLTLRLSNVYGPRQSKGLMPYLVKRIRNREPIMIDADGAQVRDFIHVQDVTAALMKALGMPACTGVLNIGSGQATSIMSLVRLLEDVLEVPATGQYCPEHSGGERRNTVKVMRAHELLGWHATVDLSEGTRTLLAPKEAGIREGLCV